MQYLDDRFAWAADRGTQYPDERALENMLTRMEADFVMAGYTWVMNQDTQRREALRTQMLAQYARLDDFLVSTRAGIGHICSIRLVGPRRCSPPCSCGSGSWSTTKVLRCPGNRVTSGYVPGSRPCLAHPAAQQVSQEEVVKLYYDYAKGAGNGALLPGRGKSSFTFEPNWRARPWPPVDKVRYSASDHDLGLES
jgi:glutathione S-transferase